jgi:hypothetical protein
MVLLALPLVFVPVLARLSTGMTLLAIFWTGVAVVVCGAIPLVTGANRGHVAMGIVGALFVVPAAAFLGCLGGLPVAIFFSVIIKLLPKPNRPLLSQAEVEQEVRRIRGY